MEMRVALHEKVYDSLSNRVYSGQYTYGDKLPSMAALTDEYGVSITTMRAALRQMQQQGLIRMAQGREATVTFNDPGSFARHDYANWLCERRKAIIDVTAMHSFLIAHLITNCAAHIDKDALDELEQICALADDTGMPLNALIETFYNFLRRILRSAKNNTMLSIYSSVNEFMRVPVMASLENEKLSSIRESMLVFMRDVVVMMRSRSYIDIYNQVKGLYKTIFDNISSLMNHVGDAHCPKREVSFNWVLRSENKYLYSTIANDILIRISCGEYAEGELLPSEAQLRLMYGASTISVRRSISLLGDAGIVSTRKGKGTFVTLNKALSDPCQINPDNAKRHLEALNIMAMCMPHIAVLTFKTLDADAARALGACVRERLERGSDGYACAIAKLTDFFISNCPNNVIQYICSQLEAELFMGRIHIYSALRQQPVISENFSSNMQQLLCALEQGDALQLGEAFYNQLRLVYQFMLDTYAACGIRLDLPPLADLKLL